MEDFEFPSKNCCQFRNKKINHKCSTLYISWPQLPGTTISKKVDSEEATSSTQFAESSKLTCYPRMGVEGATEVLDVSSLIIASLDCFISDVVKTNDLGVERTVIFPTTCDFHFQRN